LQIFVTGGSGVLGTTLRPMLQAAGHDVRAPGSRELDLFDPAALRRALPGSDVVYHLATRIPPSHARNQPGAWDENDRLRSRATRLLVDAALACGVQGFILPSVTFVYPAEGPVDEETLPDAPANLTSMMEAEAQCRRFTDWGGRGVILRLGLLWGPGTASEAPVDRYGATLHIEDAGRALLQALTIPTGVYNVVSDGQRVSNARFKAITGWQPAY
jgi:nucleoside-diphosphate-sugar epimerase